MRSGVCSSFIDLEVLRNTNYLNYGMFFSLILQRHSGVERIYTFFLLLISTFLKRFAQTRRHNSSFNLKKAHYLIIKGKQGSRTVHCPGTQLSNPRVLVCVEQSQIKQRVKRFVRSQLHTQSEKFPDMGLCSWAGAHHLLPVLVLVSALHVKAEQNQAKERHYYIAAEEIDWSYSGNGTNR